MPRLALSFSFSLMKMESSMRYSMICVSSYTIVYLKVCFWSAVGQFTFKKLSISFLIWSILWIRISYPTSSKQPTNPRPPQASPHDANPRCPHTPRRNPSFSSRNPNVTTHCTSSCHLTITSSWWNSMLPCSLNAICCCSLWIGTQWPRIIQVYHSWKALNGCPTWSVNSNRQHEKYARHWLCSARSRQRSRYCAKRIVNSCSPCSPRNTSSNQWKSPTRLAFEK
jgi:hypothetical protein